MTMIISVSWRNVWRNKLRSGVVLTAIALGVFAGIFTMSFMRGLANQRLESAILTEVSHIQVHTPEFTDVNDIEHSFSGSQKIMGEIDKIDGVASVSRRIIINSIINSAERGSGIRLVGIEPENEKTVTNLHEKLREGTFLETTKKGRPILIGLKLAEKLDVHVGSKVVVGMLDINDQPMYHQFRVVGIFNTVSTPFDEGTAFVDFHDLGEITGMAKGTAHELAILLNDRQLSNVVKNKLQTEFPKMDIRAWNEVMPELGYLTESMDYLMYLFVVIILLALGFGIVNTMLMVVLERVKELGVLMAVGMNKKRVFIMILLETVFLCLSGGIVGITMGSAASLYFSEKGLDLSSFYKAGLSAIGYDSVIYPTLSSEAIASILIMVILTGISASIYPALKALKLNPAEATRIDG